MEALSLLNVSGAANRISLKNLEATNLDSVHKNVSMSGSLKRMQERTHTPGKVGLSKKSVTGAEASM
jgi:hypothetical protein